MREAIIIRNVCGQEKTFCGDSHGLETLAL